MRSTLRLGLSLGLLAPIALQAAPEPQAFDFGAGKLIPTLKIVQKSDDNIYSQPSSAESDSITEVNPVVQFMAQQDANSFAVTYTGDYGKYWDNSDDNYADHTLSFDAILSGSDMLTVDLGASLGKAHDNRGEGSSEGINFASRKEPDEYDINNISILADIGRDSAQVGIELEAGRTGIEYTNNSNETAFRDRDESRLAARLYTNISGGKTRLFAEIANEDIDYDITPLLSQSLDNEEQSYSVGVSWDATAKSSGSIKVGRLEKDFDSAAYGSADDITIWDVGIVFSPRTYSHLLFSASVDAKETNGTGAFIEAQDLSVTWVHGWSERLSSTVMLASGDDDYENDPRSDDRSLFSVGLSYDWQRWISVGATYSQSERDSNNSSFDFDRDIFQISFDMTL